jgi:hypothetical protein
MERLRVHMIPVDQEMAKKKRWGRMPLDEIVAALDERTKPAKGAVLGVDGSLPETREQIVETELYFEVSLSPRGLKERSADRFHRTSEMARIDKDRLVSDPKTKARTGLRL